MKEMCVTQCNDFDELITQMWREFFFFFSISLLIFLSLFFSRFLLNICGFSKKKKPVRFLAVLWLLLSVQLLSRATLFQFLTLNKKLVLQF